MKATDLTGQMRDGLEFMADVQQRFEAAGFEFIQDECKPGPELSKRPIEEQKELAARIWVEACRDHDMAMPS